MNFYRPYAHSPVADCASCRTIDGINCTTNATIQTLNIEWGYWRHSGTTAQTWFCKSSGSWSPCIGGSLAGADGGQYCAAGHHGPRCELCDGDQYFHKLDAKCHECGDVTSSATIIFCTVFVVLLTSAGGGAALFRAFRRTRSKHTRFLRARDVVVRKVLTAKRLWKKSGLRYKVKVLVGFFQCVAAVPSVFNVAVPRGLEDDYSRLSHLMELPAEIGSNTVIPAACFGSYHKRLLIGSCWPIALMIVIVCGVIIREIIRDHRKADAALAARGVRIRSAIRSGLQRTLPMILVVTFLLVPSTATHIFRTFQCDSFEVDAASGLKKRYLRDDLNLDCSTDMYSRTQQLAIMMTFLWPIG
jgi:hypothetical protein